MSAPTPMGLEFRFEKFFLGPTRGHGTFFDRFGRERLAPGGRAALQVITIRPEMFPRYRARMDFIRRFVFPGGMLPPPAALHRGAAAAGLRVLADDRFGAHYARTLSLWRERFEAAWPRIAQQGFDERFRRLWRLYLAYCEGGFRAGNIDVHQIALSRP